MSDSNKMDNNYLKYRGKCKELAEKECAKKMNKGISDILGKITS